MKQCIILFYFFIAAHYSFAQWPLKKDRVELVPTFNFYKAKSIFDNNWQVQKLSPGDRFISSYFGLYGQYGLNNRLNFIANIPFVIQSAKYSDIKTSNIGIGDITLGLAYHFPSKEGNKFFALKGLFIMPAYQNVTKPYLGYQSKAYKLGASYALTVSQKKYASFEVTYTNYYDSNSGPEQFGFAATYGISLNPFEKLVFNFSHETSISTDTSFNQNLSINKDYTFGKLSAAYGRRITRTVTPFIMLFITPYGNNSGFATGFSLYATIKLP